MTVVVVVRDRRSESIDRSILMMDRSIDPARRRPSQTPTNHDSRKTQARARVESSRTHPGAEPSRYFGRALPGIQTSPAAARVVVVTDDLGAAVVTLTARANARAEANILSGVERVEDRIGSCDRMEGRPAQPTRTSRRDRDEISFGAKMRLLYRKPYVGHISYCNRF